jgi:exodeoxyribonuclease-3
MWASPELARHASSHRIVEETRRWHSPSDHVPLVTEFDF